MKKIKVGQVRIGKDNCNEIMTVFIKKHVSRGIWNCDVNDSIGWANDNFSTKELNMMEVKNVEQLNKEYINNNKILNIL